MPATTDGTEPSKDDKRAWAGINRARSIRMWKETLPAVKKVGHWLHRVNGWQVVAWPGLKPGLDPGWDLVFIGPDGVHRTIDVKMAWKVHFETSEDSCRWALWHGKPKYLDLMRVSAWQERDGQTKLDYFAVVERRQRYVAILNCGTYPEEMWSIAKNQKQYQGYRDDVYQVPRDWFSYFDLTKPCREQLVQRQ